ncbi:MAG: hypothetical protein DRI94_14655 [Bacteroidetes bacterium]|nr:MAG: hypothetical protein DRI94_14655 [Bacteroidota bacterium]
MINKFAGLIVLLFLFQISYSQRARLSKKEITVGDQITLTLVIPKNSGKNIQFPVFDKDIIKGIEIVNQSGIQKDKKENLLKQTFTITAFDDSLFLIRGFNFIVDGDTLKTNPLQLKVHYFKPDSAFISEIDTTQQLKIADIKAPIEAPMTLKEFMQRFGWYILIVLVLIAAMYFIYTYVKKRKSEDKPLFVKEKPKIPAHIIAVQRIEILKKKELHKKEDLKPFYTELSTIIRMYVEERFHIPALEQITSEIINDFDKTEYGNEALKTKLRELLSLADTVKFAKNKPAEHENEIMYEYALSFVNNTKEAEKTEEIITETEQQ